MGKKLSEMTLEELWELFPIFLTPPDPRWGQWYQEEEELLRALLPEALLSHIGSTAVEGIWAKPIIDILIELPDLAALDQAQSALTASGYILMNRGEARASLNKGYTEAGFAQRVFHLHLRLRGDRDEVFFRDYLNAHPAAAKEYEALKLKLWKRYEHDRDGYTRQKAEMVAKYTALGKHPRAKEWFLPEAGDGPSEPAPAPPVEGKYPCPCCGKRTLPVPKEEAIAYICPVCWWENDVFDPGEDDPSDENGGMTLRQGRENYRRFGAVREHLAKGE